jgi:hypothetical protein
MDSQPPKKSRKKSQKSEPQEIQAFSTAPVFSSAATTLDGIYIDVIFTDPDSTALLPTTGNIPGFSVTANAVPQTVLISTRKGNSGIAAKTVRIQLQNALVTGETILVSYAPGSPPLTDNNSTPDAVLAFTNQPVTNNTVERVPPVFSSAASSVDGTKIEVILTEATSPPILPGSGNIPGFSVTQNASPITVTSASRKGASGVNGRTVVLNLATIITPGTTLLVSYSPSLGDPQAITDSAAIPNAMLAFTNQAVTNNTVERTPPAPSSAATDSGGTYVDVTFTENVTPTTPLGFVVKTNGITRTSSATRPSSAVYRLTLSGYTINEEDIVTVDYIAPISSFVTDTSANNNPLANFSNYPVTNNVPDATSPIVDSAVVTYEGNGYVVEILFNENKSLPMLPSTGATGFSVFVNGAQRAIVSASRKGPSGLNAKTYVLTLYSPIKPGDEVEVYYLSASGNLEDSSNNAVASFTEIAVNNSPSSPAPYFDPLSWLIHGGNIPGGDLLERRYGYPIAKMVLDTVPPFGDIILNENLGAGGIAVHRFAIYGTAQSGGGSVQEELFDNRYEAWRFTASGDQRITDITLRLRREGTISNSAERLTLFLYSDQNGLPGSILAVSSDRIIYSDLEESFQDFVLSLKYDIKSDVKYWFVIQATSLPTGGTIRLGVVSDTETPYSTSSDGVTWNNPTLGKKGYYLITGQGDTPLDGITLAEDALGQPVREATEFGGADNEGRFETIGSGAAHALTRYIESTGLNESGNSDYPDVLSIEVGVTANKPKSYIVEVKTSPNSGWQPIFKYIADQTTRDYISYTFASPVSLYAVRLRHRGDFYAANEDGTLTIAASDPVTGVDAIQISHYADFRDSADFYLADEEGWIPFTDGISIYDWDLINRDKIWQPRTGLANSALSRGVRLGSVVVLTSRNSFYTLGTTGNLVLRQTLSSGVAIQCLTLHREQVFAGTNDGLIYTSSSGNSYTVINPPTSNIDPTPLPLPSIKSLVSYRGKLWIATDGPNNKASLWTWDSSGAFEFVRNFNQPNVFDLAVVGGALFVALGGADTLGGGAIYAFNGREWSLTFDTNADAVEKLGYSTASQKLYAGLRGGSLWALSFDDNFAPLSWVRAYDSDAEHFLGLYDDPSGEYFWIATDTGLTSYVKTQNAFLPMEPLISQNTGIRAVWTNGTSSSYLAPEDGDIVEFFDTTINYPNLSSSRPSGVNDTYVNAVYTGYINPQYTETYTFFLTINDGARLWVGDTLVIDSWSNKVSPTEASGVIALRADSMVPFRLEFYQANGSSPSLVFEWESDTQTRQVVPSSRFYRPINSRGVVYLGANAVSFNEDGQSYVIDPEYLGQRKRWAYLRLRDRVGNVTGVDSGYTYPDLSDEIIQDAQKRNGVRVSDGRIYQISSDKTIQATFGSKVADALYAPNRMVRQSGYYEAEPFYSATLTRWDKIGFLSTFPAGTIQGDGLDRGVEVALYVRSGDTRDECLAADWGNAYAYTTINRPDNASLSAVLQEFNISTVDGKWLQYKIVLTSASRNLSPEVRAVTLSYLAANASYFFTTVFNTADESSDLPSPEFRRGLLTSNYMENGGQIVYAYTTDDSSGNAFDFSRYTQIEPNKVFELSVPSSKIRFAILLVSVDSMNPAVVDDFAVQLDAGPYDLKFMD